MGLPIPPAAAADEGKAPPCGVMGLALLALGRKLVVGSGTDDESGAEAAAMAERGSVELLLLLLQGLGLLLLVALLLPRCWCCCFASSVGEAGAAEAEESVGAVLLPPPVPELPLPKLRVRKEFMTGLVFSTMAPPATPPLGRDAISLLKRRRRASEGGGGGGAGRISASADDGDAEGRGCDPCMRHSGSAAGLCGCG